MKIICETNSKPEPKYWFYHESDTGEKKLVGDDQAITSGVYHVRNVKASDRGNYSCIPNNTVGEGLEAKVGVTVLCKSIISYFLTTLF